jgi:hypothetical protein
VLGATDLHSLVHLLSGPAANLAAASLQLPAGSIQLSSSSGGSSNGALQHARSSSGLSLSSSSLTQGVSLAPDHCLAESLTLRGERAEQSAAPGAHY